MTFQIEALAIEPFAHLFTIDPAALPQFGARAVIADGRPVYPCRVSLEDAAPGERLILVNFEHHTADTPYRARHAIYVRENARQARPAVGEAPNLFATRLMSLRGFDAAGMLRAAAVSEGAALPSAIEAMFEDRKVAEIHLHFALPGCFAARVRRAESA